MFRALLILISITLAACGSTPKQPITSSSLSQFDRQYNKNSSYAKNLAVAAEIYDVYDADVPKDSISAHQEVNRALVTVDAFLRSSGSLATAGLTYFFTGFLEPAKKSSRQWVVGLIDVTDLPDNVDANRYVKKAFIGEMKTLLDSYVEGENTDFMYSIREQKDTYMPIGDIQNWHGSEITMGYGAQSTSCDAWNEKVLSQPHYQEQLDKAKAGLAKYFKGGCGMAIADTTILHTVTAVNLPWLTQGRTYAMVRAKISSEHVVPELAEKIISSDSLYFYLPPEYYYAGRVGKVSTNVTVPMWRTKGTDAMLFVKPGA
ncbi:MAG: hypothetical protein GJ680_07845 [Alteromonadaceae bacterium]|nr:hypothetical protein [Alteromonadaceae bacterium]